MAAGQFTSLANKMDKLAVEFSGRGAHDRLVRVAKLSAKDVDEAVRSELGDNSMSGWRRKKQIEITGAVEELDSVAVVPNKPGRGPMRVLEIGRNAGTGLAGPGVISADGSTKRNLDGSVSKTRRRKGYKLGRVGRYNGTTPAKGTWSDAEKRMRAAYPKRVADEVDTAMAKFFKRG